MNINQREIIEWTREALMNKNYNFKKRDKRYTLCNVSVIERIEKFIFLWHYHDHGKK